MHKVIISFCTVVLLSMTVSCDIGKTKWEQYTSADGGFTIYMPKGVKMSQKVENTPFGKQTSYFVTWKPNTFSIDKFKLFQVGYTNCPARVLQDTTLLSVMLDSSIRMRMEDFTEKDVAPKNIELNGYPGRAFIYDVEKADQVVIVKECIVNNRKYDLTIVARRNYATNEEINNFFNSFKVLR